MNLIEGTINGVDFTAQWDSVPCGGRRFDAFHVLHICWITVRWRRAGKFGDDHCHLIEGTGTTRWPFRAFSHWRPQTLPPVDFDRSA